MSACELATILVGAFSLSARAAMPPPVEIPINITPGASVTVPFSISSSGTHDLELQYHTDADTYHKILRNRLLENISGTVTLSSEGKLDILRRIFILVIACMNCNRPNQSLEPPALWRCASASLLITLFSTTAQPRCRSSGSAPSH